ncbi:MAG: efflux RND transporter periplasmic adaptor subunit [Bradyrhizobiaceae bacterium]|nr:efflux RND transporter periplasmic adaptor subunit [Bradyrhizobiaceae bacterium]
MHAPQDKLRAEQATPPAREKAAPDSARRWLRFEFSTIALVIGALALAGAAAWWATSSPTTTQKNGLPVQAVSVFTAQAVRRDVPFHVDAIGTVQPVVSIAVRSRVDSQVEKVHFEDGAHVKEGDLLFTLDSRSIDALIKQAEATLQRDRAQLEKAERDVERVQGLADRGTAGQVQLADARTNVDVLKATVAQGEAQLQNLRVQRSYYEIRSPATGRVGISGVRPGAVVRVGADTAAPLATVNQLSPIYIAFALPERLIPVLRAAGDKATVDATLQSELSVSGGKIAFIDNTVDPQTATIMVRASFENKDERLWPGTLASVRVTLRVDPNVVVVPTEAVQSGQRGTFVFVIENGTARVQQVSVARTVNGESVIAEGLSGNETVVTDGQLSLREGSRVSIKRAPGA